MIRFQVGQTPHGEIQDIINLPPAVDETFEKGTVLSRVAGTVEAYDAAVGVFGVAQSPALAGVAIVIGGNKNGVNVCRPQNVKFIGQVWDETPVGDPPAPTGIVDVTTLAIGEQYGIILVDHGGPYGFEQYIDVTETVTPLIEIVDIKPELNIVVFVFIPGVLQPLVVPAGP